MVYKFALENLGMKVAEKEKKKILKEIKFPPIPVHYQAVVAWELKQTILGL